MSILIVTDSTCDLSVTQLQQMGICFVPLSVRFGEKEYRDKIDLTPAAFYQMLSQSETLPTTSQVNPDAFHRCFQAELAKGNEVVGVFLSSKLSGTFQSAVIAKEQLGSDKIHLVDTLNVSFGLSLLLRHAVKLRDEGKSAREICQALDGLKDRLAVYGVISTLKYLHMGGRLSASATAVGTMLQLKPIVGVQEGEVVSLSKSRGYKSAYRHLAHILEREPADPSYGFAFAHADMPTSIPDLLEVVSAHCPVEEYTVCDIGPVIGTHIGPGGVGFAYIKAETERKDV